MNNIKGNNFFIPKKLAVGFVNRMDTYTNKLAYVIYYDHTNKLRKETSWNSWRDKKIDPMYIDNVPTEGFVLNRKVGGNRSGWEHRNAYTRVWDPRGFEFEISVENLLWILEWCACNPGKGLEGKFVYSWYGSDLVLMPVVSDDYKMSSDVSDKMYTKKSFKEKDLVPGTLYKFKGKTDTELIFIGKVKFAIDFGVKYVEKLIFVSPNEIESWNRADSYDKNNTNFDQLFIKSAGSITAELKTNCLTEDEVNEYIHRFEISAYSQYFWSNINKVVDKFVPTHPQINDGYDEIVDADWDRRDKNYNIVEQDNTKITKFQKKFKYLPTWLNQYMNEYSINRIKYNSYSYLKADISEDGKFVTIKDGLSSKDEMYMMYDFATFDLNTGEIKKICDPGYVEFVSCGCWPRTEYKAIANYQSEPGEYEKVCQNAYLIDIYDNRTLLYYVTKDRYVSASIQNRLSYINTLHFNTTPEYRKIDSYPAWEIPAIIDIPRKMEE